MPKITFIMSDKSEKIVEVPAGTSLMQAAVGDGIEEIEGACGGALACATCHVYVHPDWAGKIAAQDCEKTEEEEDMLDLAFDVRDNSRLGCQIELSDALDGLVVALPGVETEW